MSSTVSVRAIIDELGLASQENTPYLNRKTGELWMLTDEEIGAAERDDEELASAPDWEREMVSKVRDALESDEWLELPSQFDFASIR